MWRSHATRYKWPAGNNASRRLTSYCIMSSWFDASCLAQISKSSHCSIITLTAHTPLRRRVVDLWNTTNRTASRTTFWQAENVVHLLWTFDFCGLFVQFVVWILFYLLWVYCAACYTDTDCCTVCCTVYGLISRIPGLLYGFLLCSIYFLVSSYRYFLPF